MPKYKVFLARFPARNEHSDGVNWQVETAIKAKSDPRIDKFMTWSMADTPITMSRNRAIEVARKAEADFVIMLDDDMYPDMYRGRDPNAKPFWDTAFNFLTKHNGPGMIAVPYCGPPPIENIYIFKWATQQSDHPNPDLKIDQYTREEAAVATGIEEVAALPTGLCMFHLSAVDRLKPPYFYYEWKDPREMEKASTEDVTFTRDLAFAGVPIYVAWDCWAGHWKQKCVGRPGRIRIQDVSKKYNEVVRAAIREEATRTGKCPCCNTGTTHPPPAPFTRDVAKEIEEQKQKAREVIAKAWSNGADLHATSTNSSTTAVTKPTAADWANPEMAQYLEIVGADESNRHPAAATTARRLEPSLVVPGCITTGP